MTAAGSARTAPPSTDAPYEQTFPAHPQHIHAARTFLAALLDSGPAADDAILCVSELASNAVLHSASHHPGGTFTIRAGFHDGQRLRVEVCDQGGPWSPHAGDEHSPHGRGLLIVSALADDWGRTGDSQHGWTTWFVMSTRPITPPPAPIHRHRPAPPREPSSYAASEATR
jgi:serine/threonine-protein kinase RsbW